MLVMARIRLVRFKDSVILVASSKDHTSFMVPFSGGYKPAVLIFMAKKEGDKIFWSNSVLIPRKKLPILCEKLKKVVKEGGETLCWGQIKKHPSHRPSKPGESVYVIKRHMFLKFRQESQTILVSIGDFLISPKAKKLREYPHICTITLKERGNETS